MKNTLLAICFLSILTGGKGLSEAEFQLSEIERKDFSTIQIDDARVIAVKASRTGMGDNFDAFIQAAMKSGRPEIIGLCWEQNAISSMFWEIVRKMPESHLKDQIVSGRLRNNRIPWPEESPMSLFNGVELQGTRDYFIPMLHKYLPELPMDYAVIDSREKRLKLADVFDKAAGIPIVAEPEAVRVWPPKPAGKAEANSTARPVPQAPSAPSVAPVPIAEAASLRDSSFLWLSAAAAALAAAIAWLFARSRRNG